ncbi:MFS transporter [Bradyrhizobium sp. LA7.1]|uniref:MFS transporter n=1 Tax=Bradyrhizobium sp. LA7.1 TaxID=3156324 RepID=UPI0033941B4A
MTAITTLPGATTTDQEDKVTGLGKRPVRPIHIVATVTGSVLESYDFALYAFFAVPIGKAFFPAKDDFTSLILSLATFGVGFVARPFGALVIGAYGDRAGRRSAMMLSLILMGVGMLIPAILPSYATIGPAASVILVIARLIQGFAFGGDFGPAISYLAEGAPPNRRGFVGSWQLASQGIATLLSGGIGVSVAAIIGDDATQGWGWRIPFLVGVAVVPVGMWIRNNLPETHDGPIGEYKLSAEFARVLGNHRKDVALCFLILLGTTLPFYLLAYMTTFSIATLHLGIQVALWAPISMGIGNLIGALAGGALSDRFGRRPIMVIPRLVLIVATWPLFQYVVTYPSMASLLIATGVLAALNQMSSAVCMLVVGEVMPKSSRSLSASLIYSLGATVFGGTAQLMFAWLIQFTGNPISPAWYMLLATSLGTIGMIMIRETGRTREWV